MSRISDDRLLAWAVGALEPGRALELEEEAGRDPGLRQRAAQLKARLAPEPGRTVTAPASGMLWRLPPPGMNANLRGGWAPAMVMSGALRPGDRFVVRLEPPDALRRAVVVLYRVGSAAWSVVFPDAPDEQVSLEDLPLEADGTRRRLELMAGPDAGTQRWAVALPPAQTPIDWGLEPADRWRALRRSVASGTVPVMTVAVPVGV